VESVKIHQTRMCLEAFPSRQSQQTSETNPVRKLNMRQKKGIILQRRIFYQKPTPEPKTPLMVHQFLQLQCPD
jgi:hypothetical protein